LASLLWQAKAELERRWKTSLLEYYMTKLIAAAGAC